MKQRVRILRPTRSESARIRAATRADPDTVEVTTGMLERRLTDDEAQRLFRRRGRPPSDVHKVPVTIRLDPDVVTRLRNSGKGWQTRLGAVIRDSVMNTGTVHLAVQMPRKARR